MMAVTKTAMKTVLKIVFAILYLVGVLWLVHFNLQFKAESAQVIGERPEKEKLTKAMKYHGVNVLHFDESKHEWYFVKNGKRCRVFQGNSHGS